MKIIHEYPVKVFENEYNGKKFYKIGISKKDRDGNYINGYIDAQFRKEAKVDTSKKIYIQDAWLDFFRIEKITHTYIFINAFEYVSDAINKIQSDPFEDLGVEINDEDFPF